MVEELSCVSEIFIAENFIDSIELVKKTTPDVALLDIHLQEESGIDLLKYLRTNYPAMRVIMVTNKATEYNRTLCENLGSHGFVDKTEEFENIPNIISNGY